MARILVIDDEADVFRIGLDEALRDHELTYATSGGAALEAIADEAPDTVLCDVRMPPELGAQQDREGIAVLAAIKQRHAGLPVIMLTALGDVETVVAAMRAGAFHFVQKPPDPNHLRSIIGRALEAGQREAELAQERAARRLRDGLEFDGDQRNSAPDVFDEIIAESPVMRELGRRVARIAPTAVPVMLLGPTGSGKEVVARAIHAASPRAEGAFRALNCGAIPSDLAESILFGHVKGAFTGASSDRAGEFAEADGGTLFLDEIAEMPLPLQAKLLRAVQEGVVTPVGSAAERSVDVRILSATNRNLLEEVRESRFREDLYYRLAVLPLKIPPLAERPEDLLPLARTFADQVVGEDAEVEISQAAVARLGSHSWPGNVRELFNVIQRAVLVGDGERIDVGDLSFDVLGDEAVALDTAAPGAEALFEGLKAGTEPADLLAFRNRHGAECLTQVLSRAILATEDLRAAGRLLGFIPEEDREQRAYNNLRAWMRRLGLSKAAVLRGATTDGENA